MYNNKNNSWRHIPETKNNEWMICYKNEYVLPEQKNYKENENKNPSLFNLSNKDLFHKGAFIYTSEGYGKIISQNGNQNQYIVKIQDKEVKIYKDKLQTHIPIQITIISDTHKQKFIPYIPVSITMKNLKEIFQDYEGNAQMEGLSLYYKGKELPDTNETLKDLGILPQSKFLALQSTGTMQEVIRMTDHRVKHWSYYDSNDAICFKVNKRVKITGYGLYCFTTPPVLKTVEIFLKVGKQKEAEIIHQQNIDVEQVKAIKDGKIFQAMFDRPVTIQPDIVYQAGEKVKDGNGGYGEGGKKICEGTSGVIFTFIKCDYSANGTETARGQIPEIYYIG